jgi:hypothetical protein
VAAYDPSRTRYRDFALGFGTDRDPAPGRNDNRQQARRLLVRKEIRLTVLKYEIRIGN